MSMTLRHEGRSIYPTGKHDFWLCDFLDGWIDPDGFWDFSRFRLEALEALRVGGEGRQQRDSALFGQLLIKAMTHGVRRHHGALIDRFHEAKVRSDGAVTDWSIGTSGGPVNFLQSTTVLKLSMAPARN